MTEEEAEEQLDQTPNNQLIAVINESRLEPNLAKEFHINFEEHFKMANEWSKKAKTIIVTNENQTVLMEQARVARLFIRGKRLEIENFRKSKKEYYLRGGQAVDKVCTFLKNMIEPIENHLDLQEHYVEYKKKAEDARLLAEAQAKQEAERIAEEKRKADENAKLQAENERLRCEQEKIKKENDRKVEEERIKRQAELELVRKENEAKLAKERAERKAEEERIFNENNAKLRAERAEREKVESELRAKKQAEMKAEADRIKSEERAKSAGDEEKMLAFREAVISIKIPEVRSDINRRIIEDARSHLYLAVSKININVVNQEEE